MKLSLSLFSLTLILFLSSIVSFGQSSKGILDSLIVVYPELNQELQIDVSDVDLVTVINAINISHDLNLSLSTKKNPPISYAFPKTKVKDFLWFIAKNYDLEFSNFGTIILLKDKPVEEPTNNYLKYNTNEQTFSIDSKEIILSDLISEIGKVSNHNIVLNKTGKQADKFSLSLTNVSYDELIFTVSKINNLIIKKDSNSTIDFLEDYEIPTKIETKSSSRNRQKNKKINAESSFYFQIIDSTYIDIQATEQSAKEIIKIIGESLNTGYVFHNSEELNNKITINGNRLTFDELLEIILLGSDFIFFKDEKNLLTIGKNDILNHKTTQLYSFQNRSFSSINSLIPNVLKANVEIVEHPEMNALIVSGNQKKINQLFQFFRNLDKRVPMVTIEIIIVDYNSNRGTEIGLDLGVIGENNNVKTTGTLSPGITLSGGSQGINQILKSFENIGMMNLGRVPNNFFFNLKLLESKGVISTKSTPKLTTINGQEASLSLGKSEYYLEVQNNIIGTQNPTISSSQNYRSVSADLTVSIKPIISLDGMVTLEVTVDQSDFTARINESAPPGKVTRKFESTVRLQNEETIILGGLEDISKQNTSSGLPFLSRIPVLKYLFGSQTNNKSKTRLNIFITPIIHY